MAPEAVAAVAAAQRFSIALLAAASARPTVEKGRKGETRYSAMIIAILVRLLKEGGLNDNVPVEAALVAVPIHPEASRVAAAPGAASSLIICACVYAQNNGAPFSSLNGGATRCAAFSCSWLV